jgi:signal transduction histidine kinase
MFLALRSRFAERSPRQTDAALACLAAFPVIGSLLGQVHRDHEPLILLVGAVALSAIFARRRWPLPALLVATAAAAAIPGLPPLLLPALVALYGIAATQARPAAIAAGVIVALAMLVAMLGWGTSQVVNHTLSDCTECATAVALGLYVAARRRVTEAVRDRAERLDRERELLTGKAVVEERVRIARELHDVIAHSVSLMVVEAQALGATVHDERVAKTTDAIADLGRQAMTAMHRTLKLLRADENGDAQLTPQPGLANLGTLLDQSRSAGLDVKLAVQGEPRALALAIDLSAFRIVQEALTNVTKHAGSAHTTVTLSYRATELELTIVDGGDGASPTATLRSAEGHGVIGMRERAALFGGTLTAGPRLDQGFKVAAILPYAEPAA